MRDLRFRAFDKYTNKMIVTGFHVFGEVTLFNLIETYLYENPRPFDVGTLSRYGDVEVTQWSGLTDKHGKDIWEGDIIKIRRPFRTTQVHIGDNIPLGRYEEPLEPAIKEEVFTVIFENGCFVIGHEGNLLCWNIGEYTKDSAIEEFSGHWGRSTWEGEDGDLGYLLQEYGFKTEDDLIKSLGVEVIGNLFENPELIN